MADIFAKAPSSLTGPASKAFSIAPNDNTDLTISTKQIYIGGAGNLSVILVGDTTSVTYTALPVGTTLYIRAKRVLSTGTTATNLIGMV